MTTKFTPEPWIWGDNYCGLYGAGPNNQVLDFYHGEGMALGYNKHMEANANLIAAAPEMYAELEAAMNVFRFYQGHHAAKGHSDKEQTNKQYADRIEKLLIKARGEA